MKKHVEKNQKFINSNSTPKMFDYEKSQTEPNNAFSNILTGGQSKGLEYLLFFSENSL